MENRRDSKIIHILCVLAALAVTLPLLILGHYNYPFADDWSLAGITRCVMENGGNFTDIVKAIGESVLTWREKGEPRYASVVFASLQPGIFGGGEEHLYRITPWLMIGGLYMSELLLCAYLLRDRERKNLKYVLPVILPSLLIQLLCVPFPTETFYWYTGAVNYTFVFSLSLILTIIVLALGRLDLSRSKVGVLMSGGILLGIIIGGNNYATSLSTVCILGVLSLLYFLHNRKGFFRILPITLVTTIGLIICAASPGNQVRLNNDFDGSTTGAAYAIGMSLVRTGMNIFSWTSLKMLILVLMILPFLWKALKRIDYAFRYPGLFTFLSYEIYATQIVATMYVDGTTGGGRMADILYYAYHLWLLLNVGYWVGWLQRRRPEELSVLNRLKFWIAGHMTMWFVASGLLLAGVIFATELQQLSTYRACVWLVKGYAREYADIWEERLILLKDESVKEVYFDRIPGGGGDMVFYADFEEEPNWLNEACEGYYQKEFVGIK